LYGPRAARSPKLAALAAALALGFLGAPGPAGAQNTGSLSTTPPVPLTTTSTGTTTTTPPAPAPAPAPAPPLHTLPRTGFDIGWLVAIGTVLLLAGLGLRLRTRDVRWPR
jgi:LPXTG-motif cell wall-anchored protein